jgi:coenzyme F420-dependent glucose-6-phosphate dehydrogenase
MFEIGYKLCSEEQSPSELIQYAVRAEEAGFDFAMISDHYHPWIDKQGQSSFVWAVLGAIAQVTERMKIGTGVTCPTVRIHPAIIAQAAATMETMMPGRFLLGVGSGENLNEHIFGDRWPEADIRLEMLEEAVALIRQLWQGEQMSHRGQYYTVENARVYTLPEQPPPIIIAGGGPKAAELAGRIGDGFCTTSPEKELKQHFVNAGGKGRPCYTEMAVCWAEGEAEARRTAFEHWPTIGFKGELSQILPVPKHFEQVAEMLKEEDVAKEVICGANPKEHLKKIQEHINAGYTHIYVHQIGDDQSGFFDFYEQEVLPKLDSFKKEK